MYESWLYLPGKHNSFKFSLIEFYDCILASKSSLLLTMSSCRCDNEQCLHNSKYPQYHHKRLTHQYFTLWLNQACVVSYLAQLQTDQYERTSLTQLPNSSSRPKMRLSIRETSLLSHYPVVQCQRISLVYLAGMMSSGTSGGLLEVSVYRV